MSHQSRTASYGALLVLLLTAGMVTASAAATFLLGSSSEVPAAQGKVALHHTTNGNVEINLLVKHLAPPGRITPGANVFVVWTRGLAAGSEAQNLGALKVNKQLSGKLKSITAMPAFDLFITCEQSQTVTTPSSLELLPLRYMSK